MRTFVLGLMFGFSLLAGMWALFGPFPSIVYGALIGAACGAVGSFMALLVEK